MTGNRQTWVEARLAAGEQKSVALVVALLVFLWLVMLVGVVVMVVR